MNKEIQHLYEELSPIHKEQLISDFKQAPKMLRYIDALEKFGAVSTPKAIRLIYDQEDVEDTVLINRFYKLRQKLYIHLLGQGQQHSKSLTKEEKTLSFLKLLYIKREYTIVLDKAKKLEKICWEYNLFELLPETLDIISNTLFTQDSTNIAETKLYLEKKELANRLLDTFHKFKHSISAVRLHSISGLNFEELDDFYMSTMKTMRRKINTLKEYPRFNLMYYYFAFSVGSQIQTVVQNQSNVLARHSNKLKRLLDEHNNIPILYYIPNHRVYDTDFLLIQNALFWYQKQDAKKSCQYILQNKAFRATNSHIYMPRSSAVLHNIILCCYGAKEYHMLLEYSEEMKEVQLMNNSVYKDIPYFIYQILAYTGLFPQHAHPNPKQLISLGKKYVTTVHNITTWIYEAIGTFALITSYLEESKFFLESEPLVEYYKQSPINVQTLDLLHLVEENNIDQIRTFIKKIIHLKKQTNSRDVILHLNDLEMLARLFLK